MVHPENQSQEEEGLAGTCSWRRPVSGFIGQLLELNPFATRKIPSHKETQQSLPETSLNRRRESTTKQSLESDTHLTEHLPADILTDAHNNGDSSSDKSVLYLAYGSNLASATFLGMRGIKPLSQINVVVPRLRLTFDLPGIPYAEPCFAGTRFREVPCRKADSDVDYDIIDKDMSEKTPLMSDGRSDTSDRSLIGVVYEVSLADYARIIATEGGGRGYRDVVVDCYPFADNYDPADPVPECPNTTPFKAHTLMSPASDGDVNKNFETESHQQTSSPPSRTRRTRPVLRPTPGYGQPSPRYLNLIITGAAEHDLPTSYRTYLSQVQPYRATTIRQKVGKVVFLSLWGPLLLLTLSLSRLLAGPDGRSPLWLMEFSDAIFLGIWSSYDHVFRKIFGDGERTNGRGPNDFVKTNT
ncbi:hypothetical protein FE257_001398 [Aspergillus nanangensis]|uniref:gamma-glutamylcyclotransferase n=1 Tax=Aspergillus nanangensis TaxID=2582783 RepID=A0AAD4CDV0_ASPNN|nr:hypothetical protein FE257_001398 [Aspergillus nanangensis]